MAYLAKAKKVDLLEICDELGLEVDPANKVVEIKKIITESDVYHEEEVRIILERVIEERRRKEEQDERFRREEREEKLRKEEREERMTREAREQELEIKKLEQLQRSSEQNGGSERKVDMGPKIQLSQIIPKFDEKRDEMGLFLINFERRAEMAKVPKSDWVAYLLAVLPTEVTNMLARESLEDAISYDFVKALILERYKLNSEKLKQCFYRHHKTPEKSWRHYAQELTSYFTEWITELKVDSFQKLKDLIITEQLKFRVPAETKDHFLDNWLNFMTPLELAKKLDEYESIKESLKKKELPKKNLSYFRPQYKSSNNYDSNKERKDFKPKFQAKAETLLRSPNREKEFDKRKTLRCYECGSSNHLRPQCDKVKKPTEIISHVKTGIELDSSMTPYISVGKVNGVNMEILRDTGATIDLIANKYVEPHMYLNEKVWIRTPLQEELVCLPLAEIELDCEMGHVITKAAVMRGSLDFGRYLLGNKTAALFEYCKTEKEVQEHMINAVHTRAQKRLLETEKIVQKEQSVHKISDGNITENAEGKDEIAENKETTGEESSESKEDPILPLCQTVSVQELIKISPKTFIEEQNKSEELKPFIEEAKKTSTKDSKYILEKNMLFYRRKNKNGIEKKLIVVPEKFREQLKQFCHETVASHLGVAKTKDALFKTFFWPNCFRDLEDYVRTCDYCQRVGKPQDKKKAPLKIVPVISEIFTKLNVDACGPLPVSTLGNKYIITVMCLASKYPDAIPVPNLYSTTVIDALLQIFSRLGFPRILQTDQGRSFMSILTTEFLEKFGVKVVRSSVYHPQSNPVERMHRTLKRIIRVLCLESGIDWEKVLPPALFALRTVTHDSTGFSPAELVHGQNLRTPMMLLYENLTEQEIAENSVISYVFDLINRMKKCQELAAENMETEKKKQKCWYDAKARKQEFEEGDQVLIVAPSKPNKLSVSWIGPGTVKKKLSETNYVIYNPNGEKSQVYHVNMLKPYYKRIENINLLDIKKSGNDEEEDEIPKLDLENNDNTLLEIWQNIRNNNRLNENQREELGELIGKYAEAFSIEPGCTYLTEHDIELESEKPICARPYKMSPRQTSILKMEVEKMLKLKVIEPGESDFASPLILVEVPGRDARPCIDYRRLNKVTRTKFFPLPNIEQLIEKVSSAKYISVLDLTKGYWQIPLSKRAQRYAAFVTNFGAYRPLRLPFGLKNAPYDFSRLMAELLKNCEEYAVPYLDDVAIFSQTWEDHLEHLEVVFKRLSEANLHIKPSKCQFAQAYVKYLGHLVGQGLRTPGELKIQAIKEFPVPTTKTQIRSFLGLAGYYRNYISDFSIIAAPLTNLLKGKIRKTTIGWNDACQKAFDELKIKLSENPVLYSPDFTKPFIVQCDASNLGIGIVLSQINEKNEEHPIMYLSKKFSDREQKFSTTEKECAAIVFAVQKLRCYLDGNQKFKIQTDHNPLVWLNKNTGTNPRLLRWSLILQAYDYEISHKKGKHHQNADSLSRALKA